jgi:histidine kinase/DNA gyrase B/HSP90-like ATPase
MGKKWKETIAWAAREKRRSVNQAVGRNFLKTITEPITNSDSALKKQTGISHAAGLVDELLTLNLGDRVDTSALKARIQRTTRRKIIVELTTSGRAGRESRLCRVIDNGPGMSEQELKSKFGTYAEAKARDERTRSLFGRGALDVLLYHQDSIIFSVSGGALSACRIFWDKKTQEPTCEIEQLGASTKKNLDSFHLPNSISQSGRSWNSGLKRAPQYR